MKTFIYRWLYVIAGMILFIELEDRKFFPRLFSSEPAKTSKLLFPVMFLGVTFALTIILNVLIYYGDKKDGKTIKVKNF